jgi:hypothetical protein
VHAAGKKARTIGRQGIVFNMSPRHEDERAIARSGAPVARDRVARMKTLRSDGVKNIDGFWGHIKREKIPST